MDKQCYIFTKNKKTCTGCSLCAHTCKKGAIVMVEDAEGFFYPKLDSNKCINCGLCNRVCPTLKNKDNSPKVDLRTYLFRTEIASYYKGAATIGICSMLVDYFLSQGWVAYGAFLDEGTWRVRHIKISDKNEASLIRNSKYAQSYYHPLYGDILDELQSGQNVLFIGTPCQIAGLQILKSKYENLYTIELICHGVYSYKILQQEVKYWEEKYEGKISNFKFRSKKKYSWDVGGVINFDVNYLNNKSRHIEIPGTASPTYYCYAYSKDNINYNLRPSCYSCVFREGNRYGDILVGDAWCLSNTRYYKKRDNGVSLVQINDNNGSKLIQYIKDKLLYIPVPLEEAYVQPALQVTNRDAPAIRKDIYGSTMLSGKEYTALIESLLDVNFDDQKLKFDSTYYKKRLFFKIKEMVKNLIGFYLKWEKFH